jgi:hypothetical protein
MASEPTRAERRPRGAPARCLAALRRELRTHALAYSILALFAAAGPFVVAWLFPGVTPWVGVVGGLALGIYAALCAVPDRFYE